LAWAGHCQLSHGRSSSPRGRLAAKEVLDVAKPFWARLIGDVLSFTERHHHRETLPSLNDPGNPPPFVILHVISHEFSPNGPYNIGYRGSLWLVIPSPVTNDVVISAVSGAIRNDDGLNAVETALFGRPVENQELAVPVSSSD